MERSSGDGSEVAAKSPTNNLSSPAADAGRDRLSALPDDILFVILRRLTVAAAARTSVLSRRWSRTWTLLPDLTFNSTTPEDLHILEALAASEAPVIRRIRVFTRGETPDSVAAWIPLAARRLSGSLRYVNDPVKRGLGFSNPIHDDEESDAIALPCFGNATEIVVDLGFLGLTLPSSGVFTRLTDLSLRRVRFQGTCELGDIVSSPRCPCLRKLRIQIARGVARLAVRSESLLQMDVQCVDRLQQLSIDAPVLNELKLCSCLVNQPVVNISAPQLISLLWTDKYDPSYVQLGNLGELQQLRTSTIVVYGRHYHENNHEVLRFLRHFRVIHSLELSLDIPKDISHLQYLMKDITYLPRATFLAMHVMNSGHNFGPCSFHLLRLCTGIRRLSLVLYTLTKLEAQSTCPSNCTCDQPSNWNIERLSLNYLQEVEITFLKGAEHEVAFLKQLFDSAVVLEKLRITFDISVGKSKAKELGQRISSISRPETLTEFYVYRNWATKSVELLSLEDEDTTGL